MTAENTIQVLDHGFLALDGVLASDLAVVNGARVSFNSASDVMEERDEGLIRFLMVMASVVSFFVLSPRKSQRMSRRALTGDAKDGR